MRRLFCLLPLAALGLLAGCNSIIFCPELPEPDCATPATVRYPVCNVASCQDHPVLLILHDGRELRPFGPDWEAFQHSTAGNLPEHVLISYKPEATPAIHIWHNATITCISAAQ